MGAYSAPSVIEAYKKETVDLTFAANEIVLGPFKCANFLCVLISDPLWDGNVRLEILDNTDSWVATDCTLTAADATINISDGDLRIQNVVVIAQYPYHVRVVCITPPTLTTARCYLYHKQGPANPLF